MSPYQENVTRYTALIRAAIVNARRDGITAMSRENLRAVTSTRGLSFPNANACARGFDDALTQIDRVRGFEIYA